MSDPVATDFSTLDPRIRDPLARHVARLRHDLGKYVSLQIRWLGEEPASEALREAVSNDLLQTRRGPSATVDAGAVWAEFRPALVGEASLREGVPTVNLANDPDVLQIQRGMSIIASLIPGLPDASPPDVRRGADAARSVTAACESLHRRCRGQ